MQIALGKKIILSNSYTPDKSYSGKIREKFWTELNDNLYKTKDNGILHLWMTDNNGQLGYGGKNPYIGKNCRVKNNEKGNGTQLAKFAKRFKMRATNTFFSKTINSHKDDLATWTSPNGKIKKQIDYILVNNHKANWINNVYSAGPANRGNLYGHKIIIANISAKFKDFKKGKENAFRKHNNFDVSKMRDDFENLIFDFTKCTYTPQNPPPENTQLISDTIDANWK
jgi:hypothetical protein